MVVLCGKSEGSESPSHHCVTVKISRNDFAIQFAKYRTAHKHQTKNLISGFCLDPMASLSHLTFPSIQ